MDTFHAVFLTQKDILILEFKTFIERQHLNVDMFKLLQGIFRLQREIIASFSNFYPYWLNNMHAR